MAKDKTKRAVILARVSSVGDRQDTERQVADLSRFAEANGLEVVKVCEEHVSGAKKIEERPVLKECLDFCVAERVDFLLLSEISRLGRDTLQVLRSLERLNGAGVCVYVQNLGLYTLLPDGKETPVVGMVLTVMSEMGKWERENIRFRLNSGRANYIANGGKLGRKVGSVKTKEQKQKQYPKALSLLRQGYTCPNVVAICNAKGEKVSLRTVKRLKKEFGINTSASTKEA